MRFVYPQGKRKALTFSYDDGQSFDGRLAELLDQGKRTTDQEARNEIYRQVCQIIMDNVVVVPLYTSYSSAMARTSLQGLTRASAVQEYNVKDFSWS